MNPASNGRPAVKTTSVITVIDIECRSSRLMAEANIPTDMEKKSRLTAHNTTRQNSSADTPPMSSGMAMMGHKAMTP